MLTTLLCAAIALALISIGMQLRAHSRWSTWADDLGQRTTAHEILHRTQAMRLEECETETRKVALAHQRVAKKLDKLDLRVPKTRLRPPPARAIPLCRPAESWEDGDYETRDMNAGETFLPVDFRHDLW